MTWQPIDKADMNTPVVLWTPPERLSHDRKQEPDMRIAAPRDWTWATHWMPLPIPPDRGDQTGPFTERQARRLALALRAARRIFPNGPAMDVAQAQLIIADELEAEHG